MTIAMKRKLEAQQDQLIQRCAPTLKAEPTPVRKPTPVMVCKDNIRRQWSF